MPFTTSEWDTEAQHLTEVAMLLLRKTKARPASTTTRALLRHLCRDLEDHCPRYVSVAAAAKASAMGLSDLRDFHWDEQPHRMKDPGREIFHWDHFVPVSQLLRQLEAPTTITQDIAYQIIRRARIAWILKTEDESLTNNGFRSRRDNPYTAYQTARIDLLHVDTNDRLLW